MAPAFSVLWIGQNVRGLIRENETSPRLKANWVENGFWLLVPLQSSLLFSLVFFFDRLGLGMRPDDAGHRVGVGNAETAQFQERALQHHLLRLGCTFQKGE